MLAWIAFIKIKIIKKAPKKICRPNFIILELGQKQIFVTFKY